MTQPYPIANVNPNLMFAILTYLQRETTAQIPELKPDLPTFTRGIFEYRFDEYLFIASISFNERVITSIGDIEDGLFHELKAKIGAARSYRSLVAVAGLASYFDWDRTLIAIDVVDGAIDWDLITSELTEWMNGIPVPRAISINEQRVRRALPIPPQYELSNIQSAMWVLECDQTIAQGTAFDLAGYGVVTNEHVVSGATNMVAFRANDVTQRYPVRVLRSHRVLDLAIVEIVGASGTAALAASSDDELRQMDHLAVCGFPNYRLGDTGILSPGIVTGIRMRSGIRRLLTNAGIVRGMSGGPVIGRDSRVVGVCVTGSDTIQSGRDTEDQSIIPVRALDLLE